jgi:hypothetical protein
VELARNTIHRILLRHDLVKEVDQHAAALQRFERARSLMNCGRWISRDLRDGRSRSGLCRCSMIIAAT